MSQPTEKELEQAVKEIIAEESQRVSYIETDSRTQRAKRHLKKAKIPFNALRAQGKS